MWAGDWTAPAGVREAAEAARAAPPGPDPPRAVDVLLDAFALRLTQGHAAAAPALTRAWSWSSPWMSAPARPAAGSGSPAGEPAASSPSSCGTAESWHALAARQAQFARDAGALVQLQFALNYLA